MAVLIGGGIVLALIALVAMIPFDRLPPWLGVYIRVAIACGTLVVVVAMLT